MMSDMHCDKLSEQAAGQGRTVLIVDDEAHIRHVVTLKFRNAGFTVLTAGDGEEALEMVQSQLPASRPHLIVADLQMPYMTGLELCKALADDPHTRHIPAILLTARGFGLDRSEVKQTIIRRVMSKPFGPRQVLEAACELIKECQLDQAEREAA